MTDNSDGNECRCGRTHYAISTYYCSGCQTVEEQCTCKRLVK